MIRISPIRLIDQDENQVGVVETSEALRMAEEAGLDLVEIAPDTRPPVCKIMDHGKYKYEQSKKDQKNRAASKQAEMKEVRLGRSVKIDPHDVKIRVDQARKFLMEGHKVQLVQQFRGREMMHKDLGMQRLRKIVDELSDIAKMETPPRSMGRRTTLILAPDKPKIQNIRRREEAEQREQEQSESESGSDDQSPPESAPSETEQASAGKNES